jgi:hypothetical protein
MKRPRGRPRLPDHLLTDDARRMRKVYAARRHEEVKTSVPTVAALRRGYHADATPNRRYGVFANERMGYIHNRRATFGFSL